jgi:hypothetical protein
MVEMPTLHDGNTDQAAYWNRPAVVAGWSAGTHKISFGAISKLLLIGHRKRERVVDIGCGCGADDRADGESADGLRA